MANPGPQHRNRSEGVEQSSGDVGERRAHRITSAAVHRRSIEGSGHDQEHAGERGRRHCARGFVGERAAKLEEKGGDGVWQAVDADLHRFGPGEVNIQSADIQSADTDTVLEQLNDRLKDLFNHGGDDAGAAYEARVLHGVWAAAPYLHNGSVPSLAELLKPASKRVKSFKIGAKYDPVAVGLAADQGPFSSTFEVGDCTG